MPAQNKVEVHELGTERDEAKYIVEKIVELRNGPIKKNSDVCDRYQSMPIRTLRDKETYAHVQM